MQKFILAILALGIISAHNEHNDEDHTPEGVHPDAVLPEDLGRE